VGTNDQTYWSNAVTEIIGEEGSQIDHYKLQEESEAAYHTSSTLLHLKSRSIFHSTAIQFGGLLVRNNVTSNLDGEDIDCTWNGLLMLRQSQHVDNYLQLEHAAPNCRSNQLYKGILNDHSQSIFRGRIHVHRDSQKTNAFQSNQNLLLSDHAESSTMPQLEIYADDVRCTHGSTTGELDEDQIFYLRSRGIDLETAKSLLTFAFANDIIQQIKVNPIRSEIDRLLFSRLPKCESLEERIDGYSGM
jgi:Fe-S cluster assembly protein SufD